MAHAHFQTIFNELGAVEATFSAPKSEIIEPADLIEKQAKGSAINHLISMLRALPRRPSRLRPQGELSPNLRGSIVPNRAKRPLQSPCIYWSGGGREPVNLGRAQK
jgi:hypothetical protein